MPRPQSSPPSETNRLLELRLKNGLTQEQLAERLGVSHATVQRLESGKRRLTEHRMLDLADIFGVEPAELLQPRKLPEAAEAERRAAALARRLTPAQREVWFQMAEMLAGDARRDTEKRS